MGVGIMGMPGTRQEVRRLRALQEEGQRLSQRLDALAEQIEAMEAGGAAAGAEARAEGSRASRFGPETIDVEGLDAGLDEGAVPKVGTEEPG